MAGVGFTVKLMWAELTHHIHYVAEQAPAMNDERNRAGFSFGVMPFQCEVDDGPSDRLDGGNSKTVQNSSEEPVPHPEEYLPYGHKYTL